MPSKDDVVVFKQLLAQMCLGLARFILYGQVPPAETAHRQVDMYVAPSINATFRLAAHGPVVPSRIPS